MDRRYLSTYNYFFQIKNKQKQLKTEIAKEVELKETHVKICEQIPTGQKQKQEP